MGRDVIALWAHIEQLTTELSELASPDPHRGPTQITSRNRPESTLGLALVKMLVADLTGQAPSAVRLERPTCPTCKSSHGAPQLADPSLKCSVSHSEGVAIAAVATQPDCEGLGVDLECAAVSDWRSLAPRVRAVTEPAPTTAEEFVALWSRKEAVLKATGEGLGRDMRTFDVKPARSPAFVSCGPTGLTVMDVDFEEAGLPVSGSLSVAVVGDSRIDLNLSRL